MTNLTKDARREIMGLVTEEATNLIKTAKRLTDEHWKKAEDNLAGEMGLSDGLARIAHLTDQIEAMQQEIREIEAQHIWRATSAGSKDYRAAGFDVHGDEQGRVSDYNRPTVFERKLTTKWDVEVFKRLDKQFNLTDVHNTLSRVHSSVRREVLLAGNYEEVRTAYNQFYQLLRRAGAEAISPLLREIVEMPQLLEPPQGETA